MASGRAEKLRIIQEHEVGATVPMLVPEYLQRFACVGAKCEDSCCLGWSGISVDAATYRKSLAAGDPELGPLFHEKYVSTKSSSGAREHEILLNKDSTCPFHDTDRLCKIQKKLGPEYLSDTCRMYPRITNVVQGVYERSLVLSCPEAARVALLNKEGITFVIEEVPQTSELAIDHAFTNGTTEHDALLKQSYFDIRTIAIDILQDRTVPLARRMSVLGNACSAITRAVEMKALPMIPPILSAARREILETTPPTVPHALAYETQFQLLLELMGGTDFAHRGSTRFIECKQEIVTGLGLDTNISTKRVLKRYLAALSTAQPFIVEHEYIFENYLVNQLYRNVFPTRDSVSVFDAYAGLVVSLASIKTLLVGLASYHRGLDTDIAIKLIQSFYKTFDHRSGSWSEFLRQLRAKQQMNMPAMELLLCPFVPSPRRGFLR